MRELEIRRLGAADTTWLGDFFEEHWGGAVMVYGARRQQFDCAKLPGFAAWQDGRVVGVLTFAEGEDDLQIVSLDSLQERSGVGSALMAAAQEAARQGGKRRIWLLTTNDNLHALRFYQKRGYELAAVHRHAVAIARSIKPSIPAVGNDGIPLRDELELEKLLVETGSMTEGLT
ncbi:GNAT family N-acetyltransferase [Brevibacillus sp. GCM10020057]|uniref:GNAT family N-acetyltransferase n=1 Tax=Brevibacillus sp. GCM10020057 TaxID=3317327 RepID=UPI0036447624